MPLTAHSRFPGSSAQKRTRGAQRVPQSNASASSLWKPLLASGRSSGWYGVTDVGPMPPVRLQDNLQAGRQRAQLGAAHAMAGGTYL